MATDFWTISLFGRLQSEAPATNPPRVHSKSMLSEIAGKEARHTQDGWCPQCHRDEFSCNIPRCLDNQGERLQGVGLSGAVESLPGRVTISPREHVFLGRGPSGTGAMFIDIHRCSWMFNQLWLLAPTNVAHSVSPCKCGCRGQWRQPLNIKSADPNWRRACGNIGLLDMKLKVSSQVSDTVIYH